MYGNMISFIAFYFILGIIITSMVRISFIIKISGMDFNDGTGYMTHLRIPFYMVANFEFMFHRIASFGAEPFSMFNNSSSFRF
jgi:hypothetical protein